MSRTTPAPAAAACQRIDWLRVLPFVGVHAGCLAVLAVGFSWVALGTAVLLYALRMFAITGFYHRYFAHRAFRASRPVQFAFALLGASSAQRGPLWWASHHRHHHAHSDTSDDPHSPRRHGFLWSHTGWFLAREAFATRMERVPDLACFPELRFLDRFDLLAPLVLGILLFSAGELLAHLSPGLQTSGSQLLVWGFFISTVALYHATFCINSLSHCFGTRRYETCDDSRNNLWLALLTFGEGWHNNHHHFPGAARQGFHWWEVDLTYLGLRALAALGAITGLKQAPAELLAARRSARTPAGART
ncbi:MAG: acyl-CoA desaturase [Betaproteobacteria bacterium]|nr:acyl-CoA desaturase [Betaproteobacteria bacterium]